MCHIIRSIYTVCAHSKVGELVECKKQKSRNEQWLESGWCTGIWLSLSRCRPALYVVLRFRFCAGCREAYHGYDTDTVDAVLNYWAFKNTRGYAHSVSPQLVPAPFVFGRPASHIVDARHPRLELIALARALPRLWFETPVKWLQRLENARAKTLLQAEELMRAGAANAARRRHHQQQQSAAAAAEAAIVVRMQPRLSAPMSEYPYGYAQSRALSAVTEEQLLTEPPQEPVVAVRDAAAAAAAPASLPAQEEDGAENKQSSPQVHVETLRKLCGQSPPSWVAFSLHHHDPHHAGDASSPPAACTPGTTTTTTTGMASHPHVSTPAGHEGEPSHVASSPVHHPAIAHIPSTTPVSSSSSLAPHPLRPARRLTPSQLTHHYQHHDQGEVLLPNVYQMGKETAGTTHAAQHKRPKKISCAEATPIPASPGSDTGTAPPDETVRVTPLVQSDGEVEDMEVNTASRFSVSDIDSEEEVNMVSRFSVSDIDPEEEDEEEEEGSEKEEKSKHDSDSDPEGAIAMAFLAGLPSPLGGVTTPPPLEVEGAAQ